MDVREHLPIHPVPAAEWDRAGRAVLRIDGLVARPRALTQADLARLPRAMVEEPFTCEEGWSVPGLGWGGVRLADLLTLVGPLPAACDVRAGAPWRLVVSGGACYTSVKWLDRLELAAEPGEHTAARLRQGRQFVNHCAC